MALSSPPDFPPPKIRFIENYTRRKGKKEARREVAGPVRDRLPVISALAVAQRSEVSPFHMQHHIMMNIVRCTVGNLQVSKIV